MFPALPQFTGNGAMVRKPASDPRTVARDIPGIFDSIFPQLTPGVVAHFNRTSHLLPYEVVPNELVKASSLQNAMLFELGFAVGEAMLARKGVDWDSCLNVAIARQRRHFDARIPADITDIDRRVAELIGRNMVAMISEVAQQRTASITTAPSIPGFEWISSGQGDFSAGSALVEVKCSSRNFSSSDYRQIVMYWLLSFAASVETNSVEWSEGILLNPRSVNYVSLKFDDLLFVISAGRTKVEILQLFASMVGTRNAK
jgi:hypothetical protein